MNEQLLITWILITLAGAYVLHRGWRAWRGLTTKGCSGGCCGKSSNTTASQEPKLIPSEQLVLRSRNV